MPAEFCNTRSSASTGSLLANRQDALHHSQDYDALQGYKCSQIFYPMRPDRLYANVPMYFDRDNRLLGQKITCIEMVDGTQMATFNGVDIPGSFANAWIVLKDNCNNLLAELPVSKLNRVLNGGKNCFFRKLNVDWGKSYFIFQSVAGLSSSGFLLNVWTVR